MTPQEKAKELEEKFRLNVLDYEFCSINSHKAKQCALIAVDEIEKAEKNVLIKFKFVNETYKSNYWHEVKQEIEKL
jgi:hypothetical protein